MSRLENSKKLPGENLDKLAVEVLKYYDIVPANISVIQGDSIKTVWKISTGKGALCLKRLKQSFDKALFSVNAQIYIKNRGGNVPSIFSNINGQPIIQYNDQLFVLYEWLQGRDLNFSDPADLKAAICGLAEFHKASRGYTAPSECRISSKLSKWPEQYSSMRNRMAEWKATAAGSSQPYYKTYLDCVDGILSLCDKALQQIESSQYQALASENSKIPVLCHQDFGKGNAILTDHGVAVLDLDGVTFDLPARDLRKIIGKCCENKGRWDPAIILNIVDWYSGVNPMSNEEKQVLYIDLLFPHWFFGFVKNQFQKSKILKASEIERMANFEQAKLPILKDLP